MKKDKRYDYAVKCNKKMNLKEHKGIDCVYQEENNNMI